MSTETKIKMHNESGVTLVEVLIVVVIIMVVSLVPLLSIQSSKTVFERQNFARELKSALERARFDSVKRRASDPGIQSRVIIRENGFEVVTFAKPTDASESSTAMGEVVSSKNLEEQGVVLSHPSSDIGTAFPVTISFNERGEAIAVDAGGNIVASPAVVICAGTCSSFNRSNSNILAVSRTGTVNLLPGDEVISTFTAPQTTTVNATSGINRLLVVQN
jgi:type II secretory pathway pseudopilin PulG